MDCKSKQEKKLMLVPIGGLANRMMAITSTLRLCLRHGIRLRIVWFRDWGMGAKFHDLFRLSPETEGVEVIDAQWYHYIYDRPRQRNLWLPYLYQRGAFDVRMYERDLYREGIDRSVANWLGGVELSSYLVYWAEIPGYECMLQSIQPTDAMNQLIDTRTHGFGSHTVGIHIRRTDNLRSIRHSPSEWFIRQMEAELEADPSVKFYLASDSMAEKEQLARRFGDCLITVWKETDRSSRQGIADALVELYALSKTGKIYGSAYSTYSILAARLGGIKLIVS